MCRSSRKGTSETAQHVAKDAVQRAAGGRPSIYIRDVAHNQRLLQVQLGRVGSAVGQVCLKANKEIKQGVEWVELSLTPGSYPLLSLPSWPATLMP